MLLIIANQEVVDNLVSILEIRWTKEPCVGIVIANHRSLLLRNLILREDSGVGPVRGNVFRVDGLPMSLEKGVVIHLIVAWVNSKASQDLKMIFDLRGKVKVWDGGEDG